MKIINFFAGPGCGKSSISAGLFYRMKLLEYKVELVQEYAKDMTYEKRSNILEDQLYVFAKQARRLERLKGHVDYVITDSPLLLSMVYNTKSEILNELIEETFNSYANINFLLKRTKKYQTYGRNQTEEEAKEIDLKIAKMLIEKRYWYYNIDADETAIDKILTYL
jgi:hypothetical protein